MQLETNFSDKEAIMSFEPYKTPGMDNITPVLLQQSLQEITGLLTGVLRGCIALGYIPREWLKTKVIFIPKPGKKSLHGSERLPTH